jgi:hypothetical protein
MFRTSKTNFTGGGLIDQLAIRSLPNLSSSKNPRFKAPVYIDSRPYLLLASNQGAEPSCAGFTTANYAEARRWRETGECEQLDGSDCYRLAKTLDGMPSVDGTTLLAAAQAGEELGWYKATGLKVITTLEDLRYALHIFGIVPCGFAITEDWNSVNTKTGYINYTKNPRPLGGHAVAVCYYDKDSVGWQNSWGGWGCYGFGRMTWRQAQEQFMYGLAIEKAGATWRS